MSGVVRAPKWFMKKIDFCAIAYRAKTHLIYFVSLEMSTFSLGTFGFGGFAQWIFLVLVCSFASKHRCVLSFISGFAGLWAMAPGLRTRAVGTAIGVGRGDGPRRQVVDFRGGFF